MVTEFRRKLYRRGSSFETTIPMPILFAIDKTKKQNVVFKYDPTANKWFIQFEELDDKINNPRKMVEDYV